MRHSLLAHCAILFGGGSVGEGGEAGGGAEEMGRALALVGCLPLLQRLLAVSACDLDGSRGRLGPQRGACWWLGQRCCRGWRVSSGLLLIPWEGC